jgi:hypothetical protein
VRGRSLDLAAIEEVTGAMRGDCGGIAAQPVWQHTFGLSGYPEPDDSRLSSELAPLETFF